MSLTRMRKTPLAIPTRNLTAESVFGKVCATHRKAVPPSKLLLQNLSKSDGVPHHLAAFPIKSMGTLLGTTSTEDDAGCLYLWDIEI